MMVVAALLLCLLAVLSPKYDPNRGLDVVTELGSTGVADPARWFEDSTSSDNALSIDVDACYQARNLNMGRGGPTILKLDEFDQHMQKLEDCLTTSHMDIFWAIWATHASSWTARQDLFVQSLFLHHPDACLVILGVCTGDVDRNWMIFDAARFGYCLVVVDIDAEGLENSGWWFSRHNKRWLTSISGLHCASAELSQQNKQTEPNYPFAASHLSDYLRFYLLYSYGGTYVDTDAIFVQGIPSSVQELYSIDHSPTSAEWFVDPQKSLYAAPGTMRVRRHSAVMKYALENTFDVGVYDPNCFNCVGPRALNVALRHAYPGSTSNLSTRSAPVHFYPLPYDRVTILFQTKRPMASQYLQHIRRSSYTVHLYGHTSSQFEIGSGSVMALLSASQQLWFGQKFNDLLEPVMGIHADQLLTPQLIVVRSQTLRFVGPHAIYVRGNRARPYAHWSVHMTAEHGTLRACKSCPSSSNVSATGVNTVQELNAFLASCVYAIPTNADIVRDAIDVSLTAHYPCDFDSSQACNLRWSARISLPIFHRLVTIVTHTHGRLEKVGELHKSVEKWFPGTQVIASDDSGGPVPNVTDTLTWLRLPSDAGLAAGRNALLRAAKTLYVQLLDDDFVLNAQSHLDLSAERLELFRHVGIVGAVIPADIAKGWRFQGVISASKGALILQRGNRGYLDGCDRVDYVPNVFMARRQAIIDAGGWDDELKLGEHEEFFWRMKAARKFEILSCQFVGVQHNQFHWWEQMNSTVASKRQQDYVASRKRIYSFYAIALKKHRFKRLVLDGTQVYSVDD